MVQIVGMLEKTTPFAEGSSHDNSGELEDFNPMEKAIHEKTRDIVDSFLHEN